jgi:hypothetical protein
VISRRHDWRHLLCPFAPDDELNKLFRVLAVAFGMLVGNTVDRDRLTGYIARGGTAEPQDSIGDLLGPPCRVRDGNALALTIEVLGC